MSNATVTLDQLRLVMASAKLRRYTHGRTCLLAALTAGHTVLPVDCHRGPVRPSTREQAQRLGHYRAHVAPMARGHMAALITRTRLLHGLPEVRRTWGAGLRTLLAEPPHTLHGGSGAA